MNNLVKLIGIIALVAVIGFSMTACNGKNGDNGGNGGNGGGGEPGKLTVTDMPTGNLFNAFVFKAGVNINARSDYRSTGSSKVEGMGTYQDRQGVVYSLVWVDHNSPGLFPSEEAFRPSGTRQVVLDGILNISEPTMTNNYYRATVNFSNGNATVSFSDFTEIPE